MTIALVGIVLRLVDLPARARRPAVDPIDQRLGPLARLLRARLVLRRGDLRAVGRAGPPGRAVAGHHLRPRDHRRCGQRHREALPRRRARPAPGADRPRAPVRARDRPRRRAAAPLRAGAGWVRMDGLPDPHRHHPHADRRCARWCSARPRGVPSSPGGRLRRRRRRRSASPAGCSGTSRPASATSSSSRRTAGSTRSASATSSASTASASSWSSITALLFPIGLLAVHKLDHRVKAYTFWFLLLEGAIMGIFLSLDLICFFVFWEAMLVPMYFLIAGWGSDRRVYAAMKFFIYTAAGSAFLLASILVLGFLHQADTGDPHLRLPRARGLERARRRAPRRGCSSGSWPRSRSRRRSSRSTPGCPTCTPRRRPRARSCWPV